MKPKTIALLVVAALFITILLLNMQDTPIRLIFTTIYIPTLVLILSSLFLGWIFGWFTHLAYYRGKYKSGASNGKKVQIPDDRGSEKPEVSKEA